MPRRSQNRQLPVESSWRMVDGDNDSFDTSVVQDDYSDHAILSSQPSQSQPSEPSQPSQQSRPSRPSQPSSSSQGLSQDPSLPLSQGLSISSQDSIRDFAAMADDDQIITREPFQPSLASTRHASFDRDRTPIPEFFMPRVDVGQTDSSRTSAHSSRTLRAGQPQPNKRTPYAQRTQYGDPAKRLYTTSASRERDSSPAPPATPAQRFAHSVPQALFEAAAWSISVIGMALRYAKYPLAFILGIYLTLGAGLMLKNTFTSSVEASLSPLCRLPGASMLNLPFCFDLPSPPSTRSRVEFDGLMGVQADFEKILEDSAAGVSIPMDMKRSEASVRDLRTMVKYSELPAREELIFEFDGYIETTRTIANDLQLFNTHVGSAVDSIISVNRWTSRYIDSVAARQREANDNIVARWSNWVFAPFQPAAALDDQILLDKYVEHTALISDKIAALIVEAQAALRLLGQAEGNLQQINEHVVRSGNAVRENWSEAFWTLWTLVGANTRHLHNLNEQLALLGRVETHRTSAVSQLVGLVHDLGDIQSKLGDLRDRVAAPELTQGAAVTGGTFRVPLSVHIETINAGVERLETARSRIRAEENERVQQALARARSEDRMIDGQKS